MPPYRKRQRNIHCGQRLSDYHEVARYERTHVCGHDEYKHKFTKQLQRVVQIVWRMARFR